MTEDIHFTTLATSLQAILPGLRDVAQSQGINAQAATTAAEEVARTLATVPSSAGQLLVLCVLLHTFLEHLDAQIEIDSL